MVESPSKPARTRRRLMPKRRRANGADGDPGFIVLPPSALAGIPARPPIGVQALTPPAHEPETVDDLVTSNLTPTERIILAELFSQGEASFDRLSELVYGAGAPEIDVLRSHTQHIKAKMRKPWRIINIYGKGYELVRSTR
jgi:DNA-binding response OmpR family regulator